MRFPVSVHRPFAAVLRSGTPPRSPASRWYRSVTPQKTVCFCAAPAPVFKDVVVGVSPHKQAACGGVFPCRQFLDLTGHPVQFIALGERAGNAPLASVQAILKDHFNAITNIDESRLNDVSRVVESYSGIVIPANKPIVGENVFTQVAGVHADGDNKSNLYCNDLLPERFGRKREYALGKNSGKANIRKNLEDLGLQLDEDAMRKSDRTHH